MTGISFEASSLIERFWRVAVVFMFLSISTYSTQTTKGTRNENLSVVTTTESPVYNLTTESSHLIPHVNVTAVTGNYGQNVFFRDI